MQGIEFIVSRECALDWPSASQLERTRIIVLNAVLENTLTGQMAPWDVLFDGVEGDPEFRDECLDALCHLLDERLIVEDGNGDLLVNTYRYQEIMDRVGRWPMGFGYEPPEGVEVFSLSPTYSEALARSFDETVSALAIQFADSID